jgi:predicted O-methyltransferase YrrM
VVFPNGAVLRIAFGPLKNFLYRVSAITGMEAWHAEQERPLQNAFCRLVRDGHIVIDVGTNWGVHALHLLIPVGKAGREIAVEPSPGVIREVRWHFEANHRGNIRLIEAALSDHEGSRPI